MTIRQTQMRWGTKNNPGQRLRNRASASRRNRAKPITLAKVSALDGRERQPHATAEPIQGGEKRQSKFRT